MTVKTYGVDGLLEWDMQLKVGTKRIKKISFTGGTANEFGVQPAKFTTKNPILQHCIEQSGAYRTGKIKLVNVYSDEANEEVKPEYSQAETETEVKVFPNAEEARNYMNETYGVAVRNMKSKAELFAAGKAHGIEIQIEK